MPAICGSFVHERTGTSPDLVGVHAQLSPHGEPDRWSGRAGRHHAALGGHRRADRPAAIGTAAGGTIIACADAHLLDRDALAGRIGASVEASDADLIAAAYERWGESFPEHLDGTFAAGVIDARRGGMLLVRDHLGSRPLVIHRRDGIVAFASTAIALTGFPGVGHELDMRRIAEIVLIAFASDRTVVEGVRWVAPGSCVWIDDAGIREWTWWRPKEIGIHDLGSLDAHATALRHHLEAAVERATAAATRPAVMLSGGLDSSAVAAVAALQLAPGRLRTYTSVPPPGWDGPMPPGWIADERFAVEALRAMHPNLDPVFLHARGLRLFDHHEELWELGAGPARNVSNLLWTNALAQDAVADGVDTVLTGGVGNVAFSADAPYWLLDLVRRGRVLTAHREARAWADRRRDGSVPDAWRSGFVSPLVPVSVRRRLRRSRPTPLDEWVMATAVNPELLETIDPAEVLPTVAAPDRRGWWRDTRELFGVGATQADMTLANEARWGTVSVDPTGDRRLLEHAFTQPDRWRRHQGRSRAICRAAMADVLPAEIVERESRGAQLPDWFDRLSEERRVFEDDLEQLRDHPASRQVLDVEKLERIIGTWPAAPRADDDFERDHRLATPRALLVSRYLRWFEARRARSQA